MRCKVCREHAVVDVRRHNAAFCAPHFVEHFLKQVARTIKEFRMFTPDDRLLVEAPTVATRDGAPVCSFCRTEALAERRRGRRGGGLGRAAPST